MNLIFLQGKIINNIEFNFIIKNKNISIVKFKIELIDKNIVKLKAYNELADYCYSKLKTSDIIVLQGHIDSNMEVIIIDIFHIIR